MSPPTTILIIMQMHRSHNVSHVVGGAAWFSNTRGFFDFNLYFSDSSADYYNKDLERRKIKLQFSEREEGLEFPGSKHATLAKGRFCMRSKSFMKLASNLASIMYVKPVSRSTVQVFFQAIFGRKQI